MCSDKLATWRYFDRTFSRPAINSTEVIQSEVRHGFVFKIAACLWNAQVEQTEMTMMFDCGSSPHPPNYDDTSTLRTMWVIQSKSCKESKTRICDIICSLVRSCSLFPTRWIRAPGCRWGISVKWNPAKVARKVHGCCSLMYGLMETGIPVSRNAEIMKDWLLLNFEVHWEKDLDFLSAFSFRYLAANTVTLREVPVRRGHLGLNWFTGPSPDRQNWNIRRHIAIIYRYSLWTYPFKVFTVEWSSRKLTLLVAPNGSIINNEYRIQ